MNTMRKKSTKLHQRTDLMMMGRIRLQLGFRLKEFSEVLGISIALLTSYERGFCYVPVSFAKYFLNKMKDFNINMTLDEFYEEVPLYNKESKGKSPRAVCFKGKDDYLIQRLHEIDNEKRNGEGRNQQSVRDDSEVVEDDSKGIQCRV